MRRCELCSSEVLGTDGPDICAICELSAQEALDDGFEPSVDYADVASASLLPFTRTGGGGTPLFGQD